MLRNKVLTLVLLVALIIFGVTQPSYANLATMGPIDPVSGFPTFYSDTNGLSLAACNVENLYSPNVLPRVLPINDPGTAPTWMCVLGSTAGTPPCPAVGVNALVAGCYNDMQPINSVGFANFPFETFYFLARIIDVLCPTCAPGTPGTGNNSVRYLAAVEATFLTPTGGPPINQPNTTATVFQRIRIDLDIPVAGTYVVTHPYPTVAGQLSETFTNAPAGIKGVKFTANFPAAGIPFSAVTTGPIGPFLRTAATEGGAPLPFLGAVDAAGVPIPGRQFIGDPNLKPGVAGNPPMTVTGSPVNQNFLSIVGPAGSGVNYRQNQFSLMGMVAPAVAKKAPNDFDGDGKTDITIWRPTDSFWYSIHSLTGSVVSTSWGTTGDIEVPGDFDGDGKTDVAVFRPSNGFWYVISSLNGAVTHTQFGTVGDIPVQGDFDGDGKADIAVFRPSDGFWYIIHSSTGAITQTQFGTAGDIPVQGDFDGDGKTDIALFRPSNGFWYVLGSLNGTFAATQFGIAGDIPVPGDYDGDGKADIALWRSTDGFWYILHSLNGTVAQTQWGFGALGDVAVPGDYDGDGKTDIAIWRATDGFWYIIDSSNGAVTQTQWGLGALGDIPMSTLW